MNGSSFVAFLLRSPLHGVMNGSTLLITVTGSKTGRLITTPVNYYREGDTLWVLTYRERTWWRNLRKGAAVKLLLNGKELSAYAEAITAAQDVSKQIGEYVHRLPISAKPLGIRMQDGNPDQEDLARAAQDRLMVKLTLTQAVHPAA